MNLGEDDKYPDVPLTCPFDPTHTHKGGRYSMERLIACRFKHPELAPLIAPCPFNTGHWIRKDELESHLEQCREFKTWICTQTDNKQPLCKYCFRNVIYSFRSVRRAFTSFKTIFRCTPDGTCYKCL